MRKKLISLLAAAMLLTTMIPSIAAAEVKDEVNKPQYQYEGGDVIESVYYEPLKDGKVIVQVKPAEHMVIRAQGEEGWESYDKPNSHKQRKVYTANVDEVITFVAKWNAGTQDYDLKQDVNIKFYKFDEEKPVIDPDNTVPATLPAAEKGEDYQLPVLPVKDDITKDFTVGPETIYYSETGADGTWTTVNEFTTEKEGWFNVWYGATDDSGKKADAVRRTVQVKDTKAPVIKIQKQADMDKGDILDIASIKVDAADKGKVEKVWLNEILYAESNDSWKNYETVWKLKKGEEPITAYELTAPGYYKLAYRAVDDAADPNTGYASTIVKVDEIYGTAGFIINYVDKDGKELGEPTKVIKEDVVLDYEYDEDGNKATYYEFKYNKDGYVLNVPKDYFIADEKDFGGLFDPMRIYVDNGAVNTDGEYDVTVTAVEKDAAKPDQQLTPPTPKTGDDTSVALIAALIMLVALTGTGITVIGRKAFNK